jgi:hypothetical protein
MAFLEIFGGAEEEGDTHHSPCKQSTKMRKIFECKGLQNACWKRTSQMHVAEDTCKLRR